MSVETILQTLQKIKHEQPCYFVGGVVRDLLLKRDTNDIDIVCKKAKTLAMSYARKLQGHFFPLDEENRIYRTVIEFSQYKHSPSRYYVDFAELRGRNIEDDLALRDFTVDAMAVKIDNSWQITDNRKKLIDPFQGQEDVRNRTIRMVGKSVFKDDPLRLLRAFRLAAALKFTIEENTLALIKKQSHLVKKPAPERVRVELLKILSTAESAAFVRHLDDVGLLATLIPEIKKQKITAQDFYGSQGVWTHTLSGLSYLDSILPKLRKYFPKQYPLLQKHLDQLISDDVARATLLKLSFILHDLGKAVTHTKEGERSRFFGHELAGAEAAEKILQRLHFSHKEIHLVKNIIFNHMRPGNLSALEAITDKAIYRYFRDVGEEGVDTLILSLADAFTTAETVIARKKQHLYPVDAQKHLQKVREIISRYYTHKKQIVPKNVLNGHEIMKYFKLSAGPKIGQLIDVLKEAQAQKLVTTKKQAYQYLTRRAKDSA